MPNENPNLRPLVGPPPGTGLIPQSAPKMTMSVARPVEVEVLEANLPEPENCAPRRRGKGEEGVYWGGNRYYYDDGQPLAPAPKKRQVGGDIRDHPRVAARIAQDKRNSAMVSEIEHMRAERAALARERAAVQAELKALRSGGAHLPQG